MQTLGILGGGQLAMMLAEAAQTIPLKTLCIDPTPKVSASHVTEVITADYNDKQALQTFLDRVDVVTFENENIPLDTAKFIEQQKPLFPSSQALKVTQDRLLEKNLFHRLEIPTVLFADIKNETDIKAAVGKWGLPAVLKQRTHGYDGKGQILIKHANDITHAFNQLKNRALILEQFIDFDFEVSLIAARNRRGDVCYYPLTKNHHVNGILRTSLAPFNDEQLLTQAKDTIAKLLHDFDYVGIFTVEFFVKDRQLYANEMAPRVHNSGHWTIEGAKTSQFKNHCLAVMDLPLQSTKTSGYSLMHNCIGEFKVPENNDSATYFEHDYFKKPRKNRKVGHITYISKMPAQSRHLKGT